MISRPDTAPEAGTDPSAAEPPLDSLSLAPARAQALLRFVEGAPEVRRRHQFYLFLQSQVQALLPHTVAVCGAYDRQRRVLAFDVFNTVVLPPLVTLQLSRADHPLLALAATSWVAGQGVPMVVSLGSLVLPGPDEVVSGLRAAGVQRLIVHGVSRPDRLHEISSLFVFGGAASADDAADLHLFDLIVPGLHAALTRVHRIEREVGTLQRPPAPPVPRWPAPPKVTSREAQILAWVREGKSNQEIGEQLDISALTVKNHIQKILRKLGASNRAHAVALALQLRLIDGEGGGD